MFDIWDLGPTDKNNLSIFLGFNFESLVNACIKYPSIEGAICTFYFVIKSSVICKVQTLMFESSCSKLTLEEDTSRF